MPYHHRYAVEHRNSIPTAHVPELTALAICHGVRLLIAVSHSQKCRVGGGWWTVCEAATDHDMRLVVQHSVLVRRVFRITACSIPPDDYQSIIGNTDSVLIARISLAESRPSQLQRLRHNHAEMLGPAAMDPLLSCLQMNLAMVRRVDRVLDPFGGAGSLIEALSPLTATMEACCIADCNMEYLVRYRQRVHAYHSPLAAKRMCDTIACRVQQMTCWRRNSFDVIVTDPPYDQRIGSEGDRLIEALFDLSRRCTGRRLSFWWPSDQPATFPVPRDFQLIYRCLDKRSKRICWVFGLPSMIIAGSSSNNNDLLPQRQQPAICTNWNHGPGSLFEMARRGMLQHNSPADRQTLLTLRDPDGKSLLFYAAGYGQLDTVRWLIDSDIAGDPLVTAACKNRQMTPVSYAARFGHWEIVEVLLNIVPTEDSRLAAAMADALCQAANYGHLKTVQLILNHHNWPGAGNQSAAIKAFAGACRYGHQTICAYLLSSPISKDYSPDFQQGIIEAARWGHEDIVHLMLGRLDISTETLAASRKEAEKFCRGKVMEIFRRHQ